MHYFSVNDLKGTHLGFLIMLSDDENEAQPRSGRLAAKIVSEQSNSPEWRVLASLSERTAAEEALYWAVEKDHVALFTESEPLGRIRNEYLTLNGVNMTLTDLTGTL